MIAASPGTSGATTTRTGNSASGESNDLGGPGMLVASIAALLPTSVATPPDDSANDPFKRGEADAKRCAGSGCSSDEEPELTNIWARRPRTRSCSLESAGATFESCPRSNGSLTGDGCRSLPNANECSREIAARGEFASMIAASSESAKDGVRNLEERRGVGGAPWPVPNALVSSPAVVA